MKNDYLIIFVIIIVIFILYLILNNKKIIIRNSDNFSNDIIECINTRTCNNATHIRIPDGTTNIPQNAFRRNNNLVSVEIPDSVRILGVMHFQIAKILLQFH